MSLLDTRIHETITGEGFRAPGVIGPSEPTVVIHARNKAEKFRRLLANEDGGQDSYSAYFIVNKPDDPDDTAAHEVFRQLMGLPEAVEPEGDIDETREVVLQTPHGMITRQLIALHKIETYRQGDRPISEGVMVLNYLAKRLG